MQTKFSVAACWAKVFSLLFCPRKLKNYQSLTDFEISWTFSNNLAEKIYQLKFLFQQ